MCALEFGDRGEVDGFIDVEYDNGFGGDVDVGVGIVCSGLFDFVEIGGCVVDVLLRVWVLVDVWVVSVFV